MNEKYVIIGGNKFDHLFQHGEIVEAIAPYNFIFDGYLVVNKQGVQSYVRKEHIKKEGK